MEEKVTGEIAEKSKEAVEERPRQNIERKAGEMDGEEKDRSSRRRRRKKRREKAGAEERPEKPSTRKWLVGLARDIAISGTVVLIILGGLYAYSGVWPPMVVIESSSMMHGNDSAIGIIDTGDLTLVKKISNRHDVVTYVEARCETNPHRGYKTYGDFGNVIVYRKNGLSETPVIHRAIAWIEFNASASCLTTRTHRGDIPDIKVYARETYTLPYSVGYQKQCVTINFNKIFSSIRTSSVPHGGFITKGDHNIQWVDQEVLPVSTGGQVEPVRTEWVIGKAEGELPWFGLFKLWVTGHDSRGFPKSSVNGLITTVIILIVVPIFIDIGWSQYKKWKERKVPRKERRSKLK